MPSQFKQEKPCECPVCFETLENEQTPLSCGHWTHKDCVLKSKKDCCPVCRQSIQLTAEERYKLRSYQLFELPVEYDDEYIESDEEEREDDYLMPAEQYTVTFIALSPFRYEDEAILYDGRLTSISRTSNRIVVRCAFTSDFEARNFSYDIEQRNDILPGSVSLRDLTQSNTIIQTGNTNLIDF